MKFKVYLGEAAHDVEVRPRHEAYVVTIDGSAREVDAVQVDATVYSLLIENQSFDVSVAAEGRDVFVVRHGGFSRRVRVLDPLAVARGAHAAPEGPLAVKAIMPGRVVKLLVEQGDQVQEGQPLLVLEAMKMENDILSPKTGTIRTVHVTAGQAVENAEPLLVVE